MAKNNDIFTQKLEESGLTIEDAKLLGIKFLDRNQTAKCHPSFKSLKSLKLNYYDADGILAKFVDEKFYRIRYLEKPQGFDGMTDKKPLRYVQPPGTRPFAYFPKNLKWRELINDPSEPLIITEGELKAAKACKEGFPTIGLGGVYSWRSMKQGILFLPELEEIKWVKRNIYICFDSDYLTNPMVCSALSDFAEELQHRGSFTHLVTLPKVQGTEKTGLDDFLVNAGPSASDAFRDLLHSAEPLGITNVLFDINKTYSVIWNPGLILDTESRTKFSFNGFRELKSSSVYQERTLKKDGAISYKQTNAGAAWVKWPLRAEAQCITYKPGECKFPESEYRGVDINIWPGWGIEPKKGNVDLFLDLVDHIFTKEDTAKKWFLRWCAFPLQNPGVKLFTSCVIHGVRHGTGKSLLGYTLARIYGKNFSEISQMDIHSQFNEWAEGKQFVMGDDVTGSNKRADADFLKKMITQKELRVNGKYVPTYTVPDCINYFFTANHADAFFLEDDDRRFFVHEVLVGPMAEEFYVEYDLWLDSGGAAAVFHYLKNLDLGSFNPAAPALKTAAKRRMIANVRSDLASWVRSLIHNPDYVLKIGQIPIHKDMFTSAELLKVYDPTGSTGTTANGLGREMSRAGIYHVRGGAPFRLCDGSQSRYYAVRNQEHWLNASVKDIKEHLEDYIRSAGPTVERKY